MPRARPWLRRSIAAVLAGAGLVGAGVYWCTSMPGVSHQGVLPALSEDQEKTARRMRKSVHRLAEEIGPRNATHKDALDKAAKFIDRSWRRQGYSVAREAVATGDQNLENLIVELPGGSSAHEVLIVGAHYDSAGSTPGANDNGSGVAMLLELSRRFADESFPRTIRFVAFVNEEPPQFQTEEMGSRVHAKASRAAGQHIIGMISLETIGYYSQESGSQRYPPGVGVLFPEQGNFVAFVGNVGSASFVRRTVGTFRDHAFVPSEGIAAPDLIPGIGWSDHWSFYHEGYPALMVTDTAPFRYPHYHQDDDRVEKVDFETMSRVADGLVAVISDLAGQPVPVP